MRRCSLDLFCILFCIKAKKHVGFGATPQESMDNAQCTIDWFDDLSIYWWIPIIWGLRVFAPSWRIKVLPFRQVSDGGLMPQNKFCGYENSAFQAGTILGTYPPQSKPSIHRLTFAWKAKTIITAGHRPTEKIQQTYAAWKAELLPLYRWISIAAKKEQTKRKFVI